MLIKFRTVVYTMHERTHRHTHTHALHLAGFGVPIP